MFAKRKTIRYPTQARVRIADFSACEILLKDLSITCGCIEATMQLDIKSGDLYKVEIIPEQAAKSEKFELQVEPRWNRSSSYHCEIGFNILAFPKGKMFQRYVDYLAWRNSSL